MVSELNIPLGGFHKISMVDYPGHISAVLFTCGCNFNCYYCHNQELIPHERIGSTPKIATNYALGWITMNKHLLDAVVITGGEPSLHDSLPELIKKIKAMGLKIKLDTNGTNPALINELIDSKLVDYIAMDIKAPLLFEYYKRVAGNEFTYDYLKRIIKSVKLLNRGNIDYEYRITYDNSFAADDFRLIFAGLKGKVFLQKVQQDGIQVNTANISFFKNLIEMNELKVEHR